MEVMFWVWLAIFVLALIVELVTFDLISVWFAAGAVVPFLLSAIGGVPIEIQITLFIVAFVFVFETLSVILQVFWVKTFKKRLFLMTPLHHHFEKLGWHEIEIVRLFWVFGFILAMAGIIFGVWI